MSQTTPPGTLPLITLTQPASAAAEAYRTLRTNIRFARTAQVVKSILLVSPDTTEVAAVALANLGVVAAQAGARVTLLDADLRSPKLHDVFGVPRAPGLTEALDPNADLAAAVPTSPTSIPGLLVVTAGSATSLAADRLASTQFGVVLDALKAEQDLVLVAAPPLGPLADPLILATRVDGVILVLDGRRTQRSAAINAKSRLERVGAHLLGTILESARL